jgi:Glu-tRNA(Gln) amidotransferase subunit E-like FAD-binding protein
VLKETDYAFVLEHYNNKVIPKSAILEILIELAQGKKVELSNYKAIAEDTLAEEIQQLVAVQRDATINVLMGMLMAKYRGKVDGQTVMKLLQRYKK